MKKKWNYLMLLLTMMVMVGCTSVEDAVSTNDKADTKQVEEGNKATNETEENDESKDETATAVVEKPQTNETASAATEEKAKDEQKQAQNQTKNQFEGYTLINANACDLSGARKAKVVVNIGFGDREYWAFTNEHGQLVRVVADKIVLQDDNKEKVTSSGRYCNDEAKVPGVESADLDEGHVIADSLGGVSNSYNITPQESTLNRHGDQAYMEKTIRDAGGATNFEAIITYPNTKTQIPSHYQYTYTVRGNKIVDSFDNVNPDKVNESKGLTGNQSTESKNSNQTNQSSTAGDLSKVDTDGNGQVTIKEAKAAGYKMPITRDHWLYQYMRDNDGDGMVGE